MFPLTFYYALSPFGQLVADIVLRMACFNEGKQELLLALSPRELSVILSYLRKTHQQFLSAVDHQALGFVVFSTAGILSRTDDDGLWDGFSSSSLDASDSQGAEADLTKTESILEPSGNLQQAPRTLVTQSIEEKIRDQRLLVQVISEM